MGEQRFGDRVHSLPFPSFAVIPPSHKAPLKGVRLIKTLGSGGKGPGHVDHVTAPCASFRGAMGPIT